MARQSPPSSKEDRTVALGGLRIFGEPAYAGLFPPI
jgi:hypothetical protein